MTIEELFARGREALGRVVVGNDEAVDAMLAALVLESHVLIEGPPGTAKTLMVRTLARAAGLEFARIQFTPDLMPADLTGTMVFRPSDATFELRRGPVFASMVLADEINRTPPKTQAALLEAMEEGQVTIEGETLPLPRPFVVCATENPIEFEGTYPLPEAQLDRFLFKLLVAYPDAESEREILRRHQGGFRSRELGAIDVPVMLDSAELPALREQAAAVGVAPDVLGYIVAIAQWLRSSEDVSFGPSPRGSIGLVLSARVMAASRGAAFVTPDDVQALARAVMRHRIVLSADAELSGRRPDDVVDAAIEAVPVPR
ncbi:MAG TPA: MoxR family ATPase [Gaiellales bacterium]